MKSHIYNPPSVKPLEIRYRHFPAQKGTWYDPPFNEDVNVTGIMVDGYDILPWLEKFGFDVGSLEDFLLKHHSDE